MNRVDADVPMVVIEMRYQFLERPSKNRFKLLSNRQRLAEIIICAKTGGIKDQGLYIGSQSESGEQVNDDAFCHGASGMDQSEKRLRLLE